MASAKHTPTTLELWLILEPHLNRNANEDEDSIHRQGQNRIFGRNPGNVGPAPQLVNATVPSGLIPKDREFGNQRGEGVLLKEEGGGMSSSNMGGFLQGHGVGIIEEELAAPDSELIKVHSGEENSPEDIRLYGVDTKELIGICLAS
jgi:hypothetical protein